MGAGETEQCCGSSTPSHDLTRSPRVLQGWREDPHAAPARCITVGVTVVARGGAAARRPLHVFWICERSHRPCYAYRHWGLCMCNPFRGRGVCLLHITTRPSGDTTPTPHNSTKQVSEWNKKHIYVFARARRSGSVQKQVKKMVCRPCATALQGHVCWQRETGKSLAMPRMAWRLRSRRDSNSRPSDFVTGRNSLREGSC